MRRHLRGYAFFGAEGRRSDRGRREDEEQAIVENKRDRNRDRVERREGKGIKERESERGEERGEQFTAFHWTAVSNGHNAGPAFFT